MSDQVELHKERAEQFYLEAGLAKRDHHVLTRNGEILREKLNEIKKELDDKRRLESDMKNMQKGLQDRLGRMMDQHNSIVDKMLKILRAIGLSEVDASNLGRFNFESVVRWLQNMRSQTGVT